LTKTLIEKGLLEWNDFIVNTFKVPDVNKGTIVTALNLMTDHVLEYVSDKDVKDLYNSFITFVSSGYFKYDKTIVQDMGNADTLLKHKLANPTNKFLNRLEIKDGFLQFIGANTNDELEIQSIIDNWEELINSTDAETRKYGNDLIKYAFYQRGFDFGVGSFGHLIPVSYFIKNTEFSKYYVDTMRALDQSNQEKANAFVEQFVANNYLDVKIPTVEGELDGEILTVPNVPEINGYSARYVKFKGIPFKYMGDGTYHQLPVRGKYVGTNKYLQRYDFNAKAKEFNSVPSEKKYVPTLQTADSVVPSQEKVIQPTTFVPANNIQESYPFTPSPYGKKFDYSADYENLTTELYDVADSLVFELINLIGDLQQKHKFDMKGMTLQAILKKISDLKTANFNNKMYVSHFDEMLKVTNKLIEYSKLPYTFTQEMVDRLNEITVDKRINGFVYTIEYLNNSSEERKQRAIYCYTTGVIPGKS